MSLQESKRKGLGSVCSLSLHLLKQLQSIPSPVQGFSLVPDEHFWREDVLPHISEWKSSTMIFTVNILGLTKSLNYMTGVVHFTYNHGKPMWFELQTQKDKLREFMMINSSMII